VRIKVIGLGSPQGDDAIGLEVARELSRETLPGGASAVACDRPGVDLLDELEGIDAAVLVDALRSGASPGSVRVLSPGQLARGHALSSHALGVGDALALAAALGRPRPRLRIVAVELDAERGEGLSSAGRGAVPEACRRVRALLTELARQGDFETD
jgi:hydrogenase maturation protease